VATWTIAGDLHVTVRSDGEPDFDCGRPDPGTRLPDVEMWATLEANPGDLIISPNGNFIRQARGAA
jgi:hypothetical protein